MKVLGIDFTSAPREGKPIVVATGELTNGLLRVESVRSLPDFSQFEAEIGNPGPWVAGIDFPFGQPRRLIRALEWPDSWKGYVGHVESMSKEQYESRIKEYCDAQPIGDKHHKRQTDERAKSISPMNLVRPPVGKMFFQGAPRILRSGASIVPCAPNEDNRIIVEAYPALVAKALTEKKKSYKDGKPEQRSERLGERKKIIEALSTKKNFSNRYGLTVDLDSIEVDCLINDTSADLLDAVLCSVQAAWAWANSQPRYGVPDSCDALEGWIVDPSQLDDPVNVHASTPTGVREANPSERPDEHLLDRITTNPSVCHGKPCIRGLRYPVDTILELLSSGMTIEEILADYSDLEREDILAVLAFAARLSQIKRVQALGA